MSKNENNRREKAMDAKFGVDTLYDMSNWILVILGYIDTELINYSWFSEKKLVNKY